MEESSGIDDNASPGAGSNHGEALSKRRGNHKGATYRHDFRVVFDNGVEYEITNARDASHARLIARTAEQSKRQRNGTIVRVDRLPADPNRHRERMIEARGNAPLNPGRRDRDSR